MKQKKTIFVDIGGVLLTKGWGRQSRQKAAQVFNLDENELNERHHLTFDTFESGQISLDEYLHRIVFYKERSFSPQAFKEFMYSQSQPLHSMLDYMRSLKKRDNVRIVAVSNEARELSDFRVAKFGLGEFVDIFIVSGLVKIRKPDYAIYRLALDSANVKPEEVFYIDDRLLFVEVANAIGIQGVCHENGENTIKKTDAFLIN